MKEKILDYEIEEILKENPKKLISLSEIEKNLEINRKKNSKSPVSKTTVYTKLEKMVKQKKIHHINRKGYKLLKYEFTKKDPNFKYFLIYKSIIDKMGIIWVAKDGKLDEESHYMNNLPEEITEDVWNDLNKIIRN